ncbi:MAG TPA: response regulator, partial [Desulfuromonadaceae bacterium]
RVISPLDTLTRQVEQLVEEGLPTRFDYQEERTEIGKLARALADYSHKTEKIEQQNDSLLEQRKALEEAMQALADERTLLQNILETSPLGIVFSAAGHIHFANQKFVDTFGVMVGDAPRDVYVRPTERDEVVALLKSGKPLLNRELCLYDRHRRVRDMLVSYLPTSYNGEAGVLGWALDVTERKQADRKLVLNRQRLESVVKITQMVTESTRQLLDAALEEAVAITESKIGYLFHYDEESRQLTLESWSRNLMKVCSIINPGTVYHLDQNRIWGEVVRQRRPIILNDFQAENQLRKGYPEGHAHLTRFMSIPIISAGRIVAVVGVANKEDEYSETDVLQLTLLMDAVWRTVERNNHEQELKRSGMLADTALDLSKSGYWEVDFNDPDYITCSERSIRLYGLPPTPDNRYHLGEYWLDRVNAVDTQIWSDAAAVYTDVLAGKVSDYDSIYCYKRPADGKVIWVHAKGNMERNEDGTPRYMFGVSQDITDIKLAEQEILCAKQLAETASQAKADFLSNMSHEIRTPMNAIIGMSHLALKTDLTPRQRNYVTKIRQSSQHLLGIINSILDFSKIEAGKLDIERTDFDLDKVFDNVADLIIGKASEKGLWLTFDIDPQVPNYLVGDPLRLGQILLNYASNAVKFTESGAIVIGARVLKETAEDVLILFSVKDFGIGLTDEQKGGLFQAFQQADNSITRKFGGTGLGLSICKRLIELMGGEFGVESEYGKGSTFWFSVSLAKGNRAVTQGGPFPDQCRLQESVMECDSLATLRGAVILLVEDNEINREVAIELLHDAGLEVHVAENGLVAVEMAEFSHYDAVLMDMQMPVMDGVEATRLIRRQQRFSGLPIIAMTANAMTIDREKCLEAGMNDHLAKPIEPEQLFEVLLRWIKPRLKGLAAPARDDRPHADSDDKIPLIPGIDIDLGLHHMMGNGKLYLKILRSFANSYSQTPERLADLIAAGDYPAVVLVTHPMKGLAGTIGATSLQMLTEELETSVREQKVEEIAAKQDAVCETLGTLVNSITEALPAEQEPSAVADTSRAAEVCERLSQLLADDDSAAVDLFEEQVDLLQMVLGAGRFIDLKHAITQYNFEKALNVTRLLPEVECLNRKSQSCDRTRNVY